MAERKRRRLTNRMQDGCAYVQSETGKEGVGHYTTQRRLPELITFTCKVEDIMEKYHCNDIEELEKKLANFDNFMKGNKFKTIEDLQNALNGKFIEVFDEKNKIWQDMVKNLTKTEKDRDTWERACELACREAPLHCPNPPEYYNAQDEYGSDEPYYIQEGACEFSDDAERCLECQINYFYQQAKKEGEQK